MATQARKAHIAKVEKALSTSSPGKKCYCIKCNKAKGKAAFKTADLLHKDKYSLICNICKALMIQCYECEKHKEETEYYVIWIKNAAQV